MPVKDTYRFREGAGRQNRMLPALDPARLKIDDRNLEEILAFFYKLAKYIQYYDPENRKSGDWRSFVEQLAPKNVKLWRLLDQWQKKPNADPDEQNPMNLPPHLALMIAVARLYQYVQADLNDITRRHLDFYFKEVLRFAVNEARPDRVHILFELASHLDDHELPAETKLTGKDDNGKEVIFETEQSIVLNQGKIDEIKTLFVDKKRQYRLYAGAPESLVSGKAWAPFVDTHLPKATLGWAVATPELLLPAGKRTIEMIVSCKPGQLPPPDLLDAFLVSVTGPEGWQESKTVTGKWNGQRQLVLSFSLNAEEDSIAFYNEAQYGENYRQEWPILKVLLNPDSREYAYEWLKELEVTNIHLKLTVEEERSDQLQLFNNELAVDASKPFLPFGSVPSLGDPLYIAIPASFNKQLQKADLHISWKGVPKLLEKHYAGYNDDYTIDNNSFQASLYQLQNGKWWNLKEHSTDVIPLFDPKDAAAERNMILATGAETDLMARPGEVAWISEKVHSGVIKMILTAPEKSRITAFGHQDFSRNFTQAVLDKTTVPSSPYLPSIQSLTASYTAVQEIDVGAAARNGKASFYQIDAFGHQSTKPEEWLPRHEQEGKLYLGVSGIRPLQGLSVLFQLEAGSENPQLPWHRETIRWEYLSSRKWKGLIVHTDATNGLRNSGIVYFQIPSDASLANPQMPLGKAWLRAGVTENGAGFPKLVGIHAQAMRAVRVINGEGASLSALGAEKIAALKTKRRAVKEVAQPYPPFGGITAEQSENYYSRVSERLRHKQRGIAPWDFERLVLEQFPEIYRAKCLTAREKAIFGRKEKLSMVVVPKSRQRSGPKHLEPLASRDTLNNIRQYLEQHASLFLRNSISVRNPEYERICLAFKVAFKPSYDPAFYLKQLEKDVIQYLSPWAFENETGARFGGKVYKAHILDFVELRRYVDYVTDFKMYHRVRSAGVGFIGISRDFRIPDQEGYVNWVPKSGGYIPAIIGKPELKKWGVGYMAIGRDFTVEKPPEDGGVGQMRIGTDFIIDEPYHEDVEVALALTPWSILVSDRNHDIRLHETEACEGHANIGVGNMLVGISMEVT